MSVEKRIMIVDDDSSIREAVCDYLSRHGYIVRGVESVEAMQSLLQDEQWALVILDLMMPGEDGLSACRRLSDRCPPILMLSALGETVDRIVGLEAGASDYLAKPFDPRELLARVRALLRLSSREGAFGEDNSVKFSGWEFNVEERVLYNPEGAVVVLTPGDFELLRVFIERPGRLLSRDILIDLARGRNNTPYDRAIDLAVSRLRSKLNESGEEFIETIRGAGYRFVAKVTSE